MTDISIRNDFIYSLMNHVRTRFRVHNDFITFYKVAIDESEYKKLTQLCALYYEYEKASVDYDKFVSRLRELKFKIYITPLSQYLSDFEYFYKENILD